ncbi:MAG TPA: efflux RND transporter periplasmic adaptor subunit [Ottowia sp.]|uniref:efflux RND transporter periplasmic adaptor subunit n=1 Tax=Ottowia sp. TaxID=1898956 RepID=UPI002B5DF54D|nr:efflux RND transporter periplasmic adaptor subunit [Ottowia sp.]HRN06213.1 efflux RND transporter periplasmic adaptor subunit [Ottowia sp.]
MSRWLKTALVLLALIAVVALGWRGYAARQATRQAQSAPVKDPVIELSAIDLATAHVVELTSGLPISGALKAVNSAIVKARVPGELQGLTVREGDTVQAGQVIARVESTEYADRVRQAQQQADAAKAQVEIAQRQVDNNAALVRQGFISKTAADNSLASLNTAQANHRAAQAGIDVLRKSLADTVLRAPISGQVSQRLAQPGERVAPEARIVEIVDLSRLELEASISPADSVAVRVGQQALLRIEGAAQPVPATVARINPSAQAGSRSVLIYLTVAAQPGLRQGLFAQGQLATETQRALAVPLNAVRTDKPLPYVQVVEGDRIAHRTVQTGVRGQVDGELWVAVQGVADGARVLRGAAGVVREGTQVKLAAPVAPASAAQGARS